MKKMLWAGLLLFSAAAVHADILELRLGVGPTFVSPDKFNDGFGALDPDLKMEDLFGFNIDAFVNVPILPFGAGVRFEQSGDDATATQAGGTLSWELDVTRYALLVDFRPIDTLAYVGVIGSVGSHSGEMEVNNNGVIIPVDLEADGPSFTLGAEAGVKLSGWILGAEVGYQSMKFKQEPNLGIELDLSGTYGKLMVGRAFF